MTSQNISSWKPIASSVDRLVHTEKDGPILKTAWLDHERSWENVVLPDGQVPRCKQFINDWRKCAEGLSWQRAKVECRFELEDMYECTSCDKQQAKQAIILKQRKKMIKEGTYTPPPFPQC